MEWYDDRAFSQEVAASTDGVLSSTSGNAQTFASGYKYDNERLEQYSTDVPHLQSRSQYSAPNTTLCSNDHRQYLRQKLNARRLKSRVRLAQAYLQHPKFLTYKARPRRDIDKETGEVIWDEETETAFQNAIINIPGIGRKKKSQHGKTLGRNELITEWIKQETGKIRCRKQISSHMQTLDGIFKAKPDEGFPGVPEWRMLTKPRQPGGDTADLDGLDFYDNSIADMVISWRAMQADASQIDLAAESSLTPCVAHPKIDFEMWVSHPDKMDKPLHRYTRMQNNQAAAAPEPLESIRNWRTAWPDLVPIVDQMMAGDKLEIILVKTSFELMLDFPPPRSKLGIVLELEFSENTSESTSWTSTTLIYQKGKLELKEQHNICQGPVANKIKPPFESKWWAAQFTRLTEKRRLAIDSGSDAAVAVAEEAARNYLSNLKIMQEVVAVKDLAFQAGNTWDPPSLHEKQRIVLLWSFSQATSRYVGTTTWQNLIPPPPRITINSPMPRAHLTTLPPLDMDTTVEDTFDDPFEHKIDLAPESFLPPNYTYQTEANEGLDQDSYLVVAQHGNDPPLELPYSIPEYGHLNHNRYNQHAYEVNLHQHPSGFDPHGQRISDITLQHEHTNNLFEVCDNLHIQYPQHILDHDPKPLLDPIHGTNFHGRRQALSSFDVRTHNDLQAQIASGHSEASPTMQPQPHLDVPLPPTHLQPPSSEHVLPSQPEDTVSADPSHPVDEHKHQEIKHSEDPIPPLLAPQAIRPALQHHHSFAGVLHTHKSSVDDIFDEASRHDFTLLLDSFDPQHEEFLSTTDILLAPGGGGDFGLGVGLGIGGVRSHSQPAPVVSMDNDDVVGSGYREIVPGEVGADSVVDEGRRDEKHEDWVDVKLEV